MTRRALVLGGGGITGIAWETGLLAGLADAGLDLSDAELVIGTSAGSIVGAQLTSGPPLEELYRRQLLPPADLGDGDVPLARIGLPVLLRYVATMVRARGDAEEFGRRLGTLARRAADRGRTPTIQQRYDQVAMRIGGLEWADRDLLVTAVDSETGDLVAFGPRGPRPEVSLEDAVNASCAVPCVYPPIPINGRDYIDGGVRSGSNAQLAEGCDVVVAITPVDRSIGTMRSATALLGGLDVPHLVISPDPDSVSAIGKNVLDPAARPPSARAGYAQAAAHVDELRALWAG